jgi:hypothetical protein
MNQQLFLAPKLLLGNRQQLSRAWIQPYLAMFSGEPAAPLEND